MIAGLGAAAVAGSVYLALDLGGSPDPEPAKAATVSALPGTSNPRLGSEALPETTNRPLAGVEPAEAPPPAAEDWAAARADADRTLWDTTQEAVAKLSTKASWTEEERAEVMDALQWRHEQMIEFRESIQEGTVDAREGRAALVDVANKARASVIGAVGVERAKALDLALLESSVGAGL